MVFGLAVGLFFAIPLFTIIFERLVFRAPMPTALKPSLMVLVAPASIGFSSYLAATGQADLFAESLYMVSLFTLVVLIGQLRALPKCCPFRVSWWAVSFPLAACSIAGLRFAMLWPGQVADALALVMLTFVSVVIGSLFFRTLRGISRGEMRQLSA